MNLLILCSYVYFIYGGRREHQIQRAQEHMVSVRDLTSANLRLYFKKLKADVVSDSNEIVGKRPSLLSNPAFVSVWRVGAVNALAGKSGPFPEVDHVPLNRFSPAPNNRFMIKIASSKGDLVWLFDQKGLSGLLQHRGGMGQTGEVYLVDREGRITTSSRHLEDVSVLLLDNQSIAKVFEHRSGTAVERDYRSVEVASAYTYFEHDLLEFGIFAEIDIKEVIGMLQSTMQEIAILMVVLALSNFGLAYFLSEASQRKQNALTAEIFFLNRQQELSANESTMQIMKAQENEREKIACNLHDSVGQYLTVLRWGLSSMKAQGTPDAQAQVQQLLKTCDDAVREVRAISHDLMPSLIRDFGCCLAIKDYYEKQKEIVHMDMEVTYTPDLESHKFRKEFSINIYRMAQELFQNTLKHSMATGLRLNISLEGKELVLNYQDNGKGMDAQAPLPASLSYRAKLFNGKMVRIHQKNGLAFKVVFNLSEIQ